MKSQEKVKKILTDLAYELTGTESIPGLAEHMGYKSKVALYSWIKNGRIPLKSVIDRVPNVNPEFLRSGARPILLGGPMDVKNERDLLLESMEQELEMIQGQIHSLAKRMRRLREIG